MLTNMFGRLWAAQNTQSMFTSRFADTLVNMLGPCMGGLRAAHCVYNTQEKDVRIALGKFFRSWDQFEETEQKRNVTKIMFPPEFYKPTLYFDIALLLMDSKVKLGEYVMPVCSSILDGSNSILNNQLYIVGWGQTVNGIGGALSPTLLYNDLSFLPQNVCQKLIPTVLSLFDKFCALKNTSDVSVAQPGDSGGGLTAVVKGLHYIFGIVSGKIDRVTTFTNITWPTHTWWIENEMKRPDTPVDIPSETSQGSCTLPAQPQHGAYILFSCNSNDQRPICRNTPGAFVPPSWLLKYTCNSNYSLNKDSQYSVCDNGVWRNPVECIKLCPPLKSGSVNIKCFFESKEVACDRPMKPDTTAMAECKQHYKPPSYNIEYSKLVCLRNGEWSFPLFQCIPELCPPLKSGSVNIKCFFESKEVACDRPMKPDTTATAECKQHYKPPSYNIEYSKLVCLRNGDWSFPLFQCIPELCPPLKSGSVNIKCFFESKEVACDRPMKPDTTATAECKQHYKPPSNNIEYSKLVCLRNGDWSFPLFQCIPDCGVQFGSLSTLTLDGKPTRQGEFPWLAGLYYLNSSQLWELKCGGILITPHIVLSVAHCLVIYDNTAIHPSYLRVGLGKYKTDFYIKETSSYISEVRELVIPTAYSGRDSFFALDIGLLDLVVSVQVTAFIMPACVDWKNTFRPAPNAEGVVAGWGKTENGKASESLLSDKLQFIGYDQCLKDLRAVFKRLLTHDKFCARKIDGIEVDIMVSGGGLTFVNPNGQHFLIGLVSGIIPGETSLTLFTDITNKEHNAWLEAEKNRLRGSHQES